MTGVIENDAVVEASDAAAFVDNRAVIGNVIEIESIYTTALLSLSYDVSKVVSEYDETFAKELVICQATDENGLVPIATAYSNGRISADIYGSGTYLVLNVDEFLRLLGIDVMANIAAQSEPARFSAAIDGFGFETLDAAPLGAPYDKPRTSIAESDDAVTETGESQEAIDVTAENSEPAVITGENEAAIVATDENEDMLAVVPIAEADADCELGTV